MKREYPVLCALGPACRPPHLGGPRETRRRGYVCDHCADRAATHLRDTASTWPDLRAAITARPGIDPSRETRRTAPARGLTLNEPASATSAAIRDGLDAWVRVVTTGRGVAYPDRPGIPARLTWLAGHVPWLTGSAGQDTAVRACEDAAAWRDAAWRDAYPAGWRTVTIPGLACEYVVDGPDGPVRCGGGMVARLRDGMDRLPDLVCSADPGHRVPPSAWRRRDWVRRGALARSAARLTTARASTR